MSGFEHRSSDSQVDEMLADPEAYFAKVRRQAREEAEVYVAKRRMNLIPRRRGKSTLDLRFPFSDEGEVTLRMKGPITADEFDYLIAALAALRPSFVGGQIIAANTGKDDPE